LQRPDGEELARSVSHEPDFAACRALSFDCYGTLIDWETGILQALQPWAAQHAVDRPADELLAAFGRHESEIEAEHPTMRYPDVLAMVLSRLAGTFGETATDAECTDFGASVGSWPAFADTAEALRRLSKRFALIIVSNVDDVSFAASARRLGVGFAAVVTAEQVGSYKPNLGHFIELHHRLDGLGVGRRELIHVAQSLFSRSRTGAVHWTAVGVDRPPRSAAWIRRHPTRRRRRRTPLRLDEVIRRRRRHFEPMSSSNTVVAG
jgi:2-haloacid dehalogenase